MKAAAHLLSFYGSVAQSEERAYNGKSDLSRFGWALATSSSLWRSDLYLRLHRKGVR